MMIHCAGKLGVIDYLVEQQHQIAFALGIIDEVPIPMCNDNYSHDGFTFDASVDAARVSDPGIRIETINLFIVQITNHTFAPEKVFTATPEITLNELYAFSLVDSSFRPPACTA